jgi:DNA polymerase-3 subunit gamma/tau
MMAVKRGEGDFPRVYRPCRLSEVYGQEKIKQGIKAMLESGEVYHSFLFHGESGTGKTTFAKIIAMGLLCQKSPTAEPCGECDSCKRIIGNFGNLALFDFNAADFNNIDTIRELRKNHFHTMPFNSAKQIFIFDECQRLTEPAQAALLTEIETSPPHNYFIFCSTDPQKILKPLKNRCAQYEFEPLDKDEISKLLLKVCEIEKVQPDQKII